MSGIRIGPHRMEGADKSTDIKALKLEASNYDMSLKARSDGLRKTHQTSLLFTQCEKCIQIEKILSTAFYAANYSGLNEPLGSK